MLDCNHGYYYSCHTYFQRFDVIIGEINQIKLIRAVQIIGNMNPAIGNTCPYLFTPLKRQLIKSWHVIFVSYKLLRKGEFIFMS